MWAVVYRRHPGSSLKMLERVFDDREKADAEAQARRQFQGSACWVIFFEDPRMP